MVEWDQKSEDKPEGPVNGETFSLDKGKEFIEGHENNELDSEKKKPKRCPKSEVARDRDKDRGKKEPFNDGLL
jgi:hypothetical protein